MISLKKVKNIADKNGLRLIETKQLFGGDINEVFLVKCENGKFVIKVNDALKFPGMFAAEAKGLKLLKKTKSFKIPEVFKHGKVEHISFLILEYISTGNQNPNFWGSFAINLAKLHKTTQNQFGLDHNNYIGSLIQQNSLHTSPSEFYITQRLLPQFKMAIYNGFNFKDLEKFFKNISEEIPKQPPSLIHGDLWNGNFMTSENDQSVLIDPAVAFAPREMDIAMMKLFGGFPENVFSNYNQIFPLKDNWEKRLPLWQLYYLLVHLNLFGAGYLGQIKAIITKYS